MTGPLGEDDRIVELLRGLDPGEPPVALGPGSALRRVVARRRVRRQAFGAGLAAVLVAGGVIGGVAGARHSAAPADVADRPVLQGVLPALGSSSGPVAVATGRPSRGYTGSGSPTFAVPPPNPTQSGRAEVAPRSSVHSAAASAKVAASRAAGAAAVGFSASAGPYVATAIAGTKDGPANPTTSGSASGPAGSTVVTVGQPVYLTLSVAATDPDSAWFVASYDSPQDGSVATPPPTCAQAQAAGSARSSLQQTWSASFSTPGVYPFSVVVVDVCGSGGTQRRDLTVTVYSPPAVAAAPASVSPSPSMSPSDSPAPPSASASPLPSPSPSS